MKRWTDSGRGHHLRVFRRGDALRHDLHPAIVVAMVVALVFGLTLWITNLFTVLPYRCVWVEDVYRDTTHAALPLQFMLLLVTVGLAWWLFSAVVDARASDVARRPGNLAAIVALLVFVAGLAVTLRTLGAWVDEDSFRRHGLSPPQARLALTADWMNLLVDADHCAEERDAFGEWRIVEADGGGSWAPLEALRFGTVRDLAGLDGNGETRLTAWWSTSWYPHDLWDRDRLRRLRVPGPGPLHVGARGDAERDRSVWIVTEQSQLVYLRRFIADGGPARQELVLVEESSDIRRGYEPPRRILLERIDAIGDDPRSKWFPP